MHNTITSPSQKSLMPDDLQSESAHEPIVQPEKVRAGGLRIQPSPFNQRVSEESTAWAAPEQAQRRMLIHKSIQSLADV